MSNNQEVYSVNAQDIVKENLSEITELMDDIKVQLQKYESLTRCHHGHAGDLAELKRILSDAYMFVAEAE